MKDSFSMTGGRVWFQDDPRALISCVNVNLYLQPLPTGARASITAWVPPDDQALDFQKENTIIDPSLAQFTGGFQLL